MFNRSLLPRLASFAVAFSPLVAHAQTETPGKHDMKQMEMEHHGSSAWKELDAFHILLAATWHPIAKSGDVGPVNAKAADLARAAELWAASKPPASCDTKAIREAVPAVTAAARKVADLVARKAPDSDVKAALKATHEKFEVVEEGCH